MDKDFSQATEDFITQRIDWHGHHESDSANTAYMDLHASVGRLRETLTEEQKVLLRICEGAYHIADGETIRFFYTAGFRDAIRFLLQFGEDAVV